MHENPEKISLYLKRVILETIYQAKSGHTGGSLSCLDIILCLYLYVLKTDPQNPLWQERDRFILSKGHSVEALYAVLGYKGFFPMDNLSTVCKYNSPFIGHPSRKVPGIEMNTGSLGHGLGLGTGMALAAKRDKKKWRVFVLLGDGELAEGSNWEAAMAAGHYKLDNLTGIIDRNCLQISGDTEEIMALEPLKEKWTSFGWSVIETDGHDFNSMRNLFNLKTDDGKPRMIICKTVKGCGVSFMENKASWHHGVPTKQELDLAIKELRYAEERLK